jgi:hypothetical protein
MQGIMEYPFMSRNAFDELVTDFLKECNPAYRRKAVITQDDYDMIIEILKEPEDTSLATSKERFWVKTNFHLRDIGTAENPILQVVTQKKGKQAGDRVVYPFENLYDILGRIHGDMQKHAGAKKMFDMVRISRNGFYVCQN